MTPVEFSFEGELAELFESLFSASPAAASARRTLSGTSATKSKGRPLAPKTIAIRAAIVSLTRRYEKMTVRGIFYKLVDAGVVEKSETKGYRPVQRQVLIMRKENLLRWSFVADGTRWVRQATTYEGIEDALAQTARLYRRDLWAGQGRRVEVWLEKDTLADLIYTAVDKWAAPLYVSRGTPSATYVHSAAMSAVEDGRPVTVFCLYDYDAGGERAFRTVRNGLEEYAGGLVDVIRLGLTAEQVAEWALPTRPAKRSDPEAAKWGDEAVELDAADPDQLTDLVDEAIGSMVDQRALEVAERVEEEERAGIEGIAQHYKNGGGR